MNSNCSHDSCFLSDPKHSSSRRFLLSHLLMFWFSQQLQFHFFAINSQTRKCSMAICLFLSLQSSLKRFHVHVTILIYVSLFIDKDPILTISIFGHLRRNKRRDRFIQKHDVVTDALFVQRPPHLCNFVPGLWLYIIIIIFYLPYLYNTKNLFTAVITRRRGDPGSHRAYGRGTSLTLINELKKKCCNMRLGQFSDYLSKNSCIFVLKLRRFDEGVTETGREFQILGPWQRTENCLRFVRYKCVR